MWYFIKICLICIIGRTEGIEDGAWPTLSDGKSFIFYSTEKYTFE